MILATDLDRTLLPNGKEEYDDTLPLLFDIIKRKGLTLLYVTGRNMPLFMAAQNKYNIAAPDYLIASVGTELFVKDGGTLVQDEDWHAHIRAQTPGWDVALFKERIGTHDTLRLQEDDVQNEFKLSYYIDLDEADATVAHIKGVLAELTEGADVVYSIEPLKDVGLIDVLPKAATKLAAIEFVRGRLGLAKEDVVYCGDSGNDILPLTHGYKSVMVKNTHPDTLREVLAENKDAYIAKGTGNYNGNYSSGVLEGLLHFGIIATTELSTEPNKQKR